MTGEAEKSTTVQQACDCCEIEITGTPVVRDGKAYCCEGCAGGGPCTCDYSDRKAEPAGVAAGAATRGDVVTLLRDTLSLLENWQQRPGETPTVDVADALSLAGRLREEAATTPAPAAKPSAATAALSVSGLGPGKPLQELIRAARELAPGRSFQLEITPEGVAVFHVDARALAPLCETVASLDGYRITSIWQEPEGANIVLEAAASEASAPAAPAAPAAQPPAAPAAAAWEVGVDAFLNARHQVTGERDEAPHPHSWRFQARLAGESGDDGTPPLGFEAVRDIVEKQLAPYRDRFINKVAPFDNVAPTTGNLAAVFYDKIAAELAGQGLRLDSLCVWDSPTSYFVYRGRTG